VPQVSLAERARRRRSRAAVVIVPESQGLVDVVLVQVNRYVRSCVCKVNRYVRSCVCVLVMVACIPIVSTDVRLGLASVPTQWLRSLQSEGTTVGGNRCLTVLVISREAVRAPLSKGDYGPMDSTQRRRFVAVLQSTDPGHRSSELGASADSRVSVISAHSVTAFACSPIVYW
jgi:hypothetical protein